MKNQQETQNQIRAGQSTKVAIASLNDTVSSIAVAIQPQRRKRRVNYMKKIMNDPWVLNA